MKVIKQKISDLLLLEPACFEDERGCFIVGYQEDIFLKNEIRDHFMQDNHSRSRRGVIRGLHYQLDPKAQSKVIRVIRGAIYDVAVDIRKSSPTFGQHAGVILSAENKRMLYVPKGFAHGFCALEEDTDVLYKVAGDYSPKHERGILYSDPALNISWPDAGCKFILSDRDNAFPNLRDAEVFS